MGKSHGTGSVTPLIPILLVLILTGACPSREAAVGQPPTTPAAPARVSVVEEPAPAERVRRADAALAAGKTDEAEALIARLLTTRPDHLEGRVLRARLRRATGDEAGEKEAWSEVERILVFRGKQQPFQSERNLHAATRHYLAAERRQRARLFLDELWRRFATGEWSVKTQLLVAEMEFIRRRWDRVSEACGVLTRLRPDRVAEVKRCQELMRAAVRLQEVGPPPADGAAGWRWEHPLPQGNTLSGVWVSPRGKLFAVGKAGTILHGGRGRVSVARSSTRWPLHGVWGTSESSVYAVGAAGIVLHHDGKKWRTVRQAAPEHPDLWGVFSAAPGHVVAVGDRGTVVQLRGGKWTTSRPASVTLRGVWGVDPDNLFAVGAGGALVRLSDNQWRSLPSDAYEDLWSVWGSGPDHVLAAGNRMTVVQYDGTKSREDVVGRHHYRHVWGLGEKLAFAVGTSGAVARFNGRSWRPESSGTLVDLYGVGGSSRRDVWAVGQGGTVLRRRGTRWTRVAGGSREMLVAVVAGPGTGQGSALGEKGALLRRSRRGRWRVSETLPLLGRYTDLWSDGARSVAVGRRGLMVVRKGTSWKQVKTGTPEDLLAVHGFEGGIVAVGTRGTVIRVQGDAVTRDVSPTGLDLHGVWALDGRRMLAVGNRGKVLRFDGTRWADEDSGVLRALFGVWITGDGSAAYAVGEGGVVIRHDGARWRAMKTPIAQRLADIWGFSPTQVFAVSRRGSVIYYDGSSWTVQDCPAACLTAIHGDPATGVLAVGRCGSILRWQPR